MTTPRSHGHPCNMQSSLEGQSAKSCAIFCRLATMTRAHPSVRSVGVGLLVRTQPERDLASPRSGVQPRLYFACSPPRLGAAWAGCRPLAAVRISASHGMQAAPQSSAVECRMQNAVAGAGAASMRCSLPVLTAYMLLGMQQCQWSASGHAERLPKGRCYLHGAHSGATIACVPNMALRQSAKRTALQVKNANK